MPEFVTNSSLAPVAACSKTVTLFPSRSTKDLLSFGASLLVTGEAIANEPRASPAETRWLQKRIFKARDSKNAMYECTCSLWNTSACYIEGRQDRTRHLHTTSRRKQVLTVDGSHFSKTRSKSHSFPECSAAFSKERQSSSGSIAGG